MDELMKDVLYISYEGMTDPLGQSQVLSYLEKLAAVYPVTLISCEKKARFKQSGDEIQKKCVQAGIEWHPLFYTKKPPVFSTVYDVWQTTKKAKTLYKKNKFPIVHCRSYISSLTGLLLKKKYGVKFIFDMRGFWIDERVEAGYWNQKNPLYRQVTNYFRRKEQEFYEQSDIIVTLTHASKKVIEKDKPHLASKIRVIPTCVNLDVFKPFDSAVRKDVRKKLGISPDAFVLLYSGGFGANYNISFLLEVYKRIQLEKSDACILILSKDGVTGLENEKNTERIFSVSLPYSQVGDYLMAGDLGVINYTNDFSVAARSPTKLAEYWACGLPAVAPKGIGDVDHLFSHYPDSGFLYDDTTFSKELDKLPAISKDALRSYAEDYFGLHKGVKMYGLIYANLLKNE